MTDQVILVNEQDEAIGTMEKIEAHRRGKLHRAFSILVFNSKGEMLLQKRSRHKYHSGGLWTNACCSHPLPEEKIEAAARRRLQEEMGIELDPQFAYRFIYKAALDHGLTEYEFDHVFTAIFDGHPSINALEVEDWKFVHPSWVKEDMKKHPENYTCWFKLIMNNPSLDSRFMSNELYA